MSAFPRTRFATTVLPWRSLASMGAADFEPVRDADSGNESAADDDRTELATAVRTE